MSPSIWTVKSFDDRVIVVRRKGRLARDRQALLAELCARLMEDLERQLFAPEADRFLALVQGKSLDEAVRFYFSEVGRKWDPVRLRLETVEAA